MFEVGKKYTGNHAGHYECVFSDKENAVLKFICGSGSSLQIVSNLLDARHYKELPPEPARWSTWQNVYNTPERGWPCSYPSREKAIEQGSNGNGRFTKALIRRDFERYEGQPENCVKIEFEPI